MHYTFTLDYFPPEYLLGKDLGRDSKVMQSVRSHHLPAVEDSRSPFECLRDQTVEKLASVGAIQSNVEPTLAKRTSLNGKIELEAQQWDLLASGQTLAQLRMVYIRGAKNEIINTWIFPSRPQITPVYAAELISVSGVVRVAFVDIQTPAACQATTDEVRLLTALLAPRFVELPCDEAAPDWAVHASTGHFTYARNVPTQQIPVVQNCYLAYLETYLNAFASNDSIHSTASNPSDAAALSDLHEYQLHHMQHSPGGNYLSKLFGADWTTSFMHSFLFVTPTQI
jgi:hypothetical protein